MLKRLKRFFFPPVTLDEWIRLSSYYCIEKRENIDEEVGHYLPNFQAFANFLSYFGTNFQTAWDVTKDRQTNTEDLIMFLNGYGKTPEPSPFGIPLEHFELNGEFGEGNHWFSPTTIVEFDGEPINFIWYKTTPYDDGVFIKENPNSFVLEVVLNSGKIITFTFVHKMYSV